MSLVTKTKTIPPARQQITSLTEPFSFSWTFLAPPGKKLDELIVSISVLATSGIAATGDLNDLIKEIKAFAEGKEIMNIDGDTIGMAALASHVFQPDSAYANSPGNPLVVRNPTIVASTTATYYFSARVKAPLPGAAIKVVLNTNAADTVTTVVTALTGSVSVTAVWSDKVDRQFTIFARKASGATKRTYNGVLKGMFASDSNFSTVGDGIELENDLTPEQVLERQSQGADETRGLSANGTGTARTSGPLLITDPCKLGTTVGAFQLYMRSLIAKQAKLGFNVATDLLAVVFSDIPTSDILES